jgi:hypothetical protein
MSSVFYNIFLVLLLLGCNWPSLTVVKHMNKSTELNTLLLLSSFLFDCAVFAVGLLAVDAANKNKELNYHHHRNTGLIYPLRRSYRGLDNTT